MARTAPTGMFYSCLGAYDTDELLVERAGQVSRRAELLARLGRGEMLGAIQTPKMCDWAIAKLDAELQRRGG